jgi:TonB family protein
MVRDDSGRDSNLHLLLEDYGKQPQQRPGDSSPARPDPLPIRLLIDDYPARKQDWLARFSTVAPLSGRLAKPPAPEASVPRLFRQPLPLQVLPLQLLIEEYDPARRQRGGEAGYTNGAGRLASTAPPISAEPDDSALDFEVHWEDGRVGSRRWRAVSASAAVHVAAAVFLFLLPPIVPDAIEMTADLSAPQIIVLAPPEALLRELARQDQSQRPAPKEFSGEAESPVPLLAPPAPAPQAAAPQPTAPQPKAAPPPPPVEEDVPPPETPSPAPPTETLEEAAPPVPAATSPSPGEIRPGAELARARRPDELPAPRAPSSARPKLELETPPATSPGRQGPLEFGSLTLNAPPGQMVNEAVQQLSQGGSRGRQAVGDDFGTAGVRGQLPPSPGNTGSNLELLSDAQGVDFRPYLTQVLASVRRNWYAVIPESARLGFAKGRVLIQFAIVRDGSVSKLVIATSSGTQPLDRAAVAGISASNPFPPLPSEYKGADVRLQFSFLYNIKTR